MKESRTPSGAALYTIPQPGRRVSVHVDRGSIDDATPEQTAAVYDLAIAEIKATGKKGKEYSFVAAAWYWQLSTTVARKQALIDALLRIEAGA